MAPSGPESIRSSRGWFTPIDVLERDDAVSSPTRQEYVLLSDVLGLSVLVAISDGSHRALGHLDSVILFRTSP